MAAIVRGGSEPPCAPTAVWPGGRPPPPASPSPARAAAPAACRRRAGARRRDRGRERVRRLPPVAAHRPQRRPDRPARAEGPPHAGRVAAGAAAAAPADGAERVARPHPGRAGLGRDPGRQRQRQRPLGARGAPEAADREPHQADDGAAVRARSQAARQALPGHTGDGRRPGYTISLHAGQKVTSRQMLAGALIASANDAANALAVHTAGSVGKFVARMNAEAGRLGLSDTHYSNPSGIFDHDNRSSAWDVADLSRHVLRKPLLERLVGERAYQSGNDLFVSRNRLLWSYHGAIGVKTGATTAAGNCLGVAAATRLINWRFRHDRSAVSRKCHGSATASVRGQTPNGGSAPERRAAAVA